MSLTIPSLPLPFLTFALFHQVLLLVWFSAIFMLHVYAEAEAAVGRTWKDGLIENVSPMEYIEYV